MFSIILILCPQVHVLNLPIGYKTPSVGKDAAHLENCKWKVEEQNGRKWQSLVSPIYELENTNAKIYFQLKRVIPAVLLLSSIGFFISFIFQWMHSALHTNIQNQPALVGAIFITASRSLFKNVFSSSKNNFQHVSFKGQRKLLLGIKWDKCQWPISQEPESMCWRIQGSQ